MKSKLSFAILLSLFSWKLQSSSALNAIFIRMLSFVEHEIWENERIDKRHTQILLDLFSSVLFSFFRALKLK